MAMSMVIRLLLGLGLATGTLLVLAGMPGELGHDARPNG